jgi:hypothetical protein
MLGNAFRNADNEGDFGSDGLFNTRSGNGGTIGCAVSMGIFRLHRKFCFLRDEDSSRSGAGLLHGLADIGEDGQAEMCLAGLLGVCSSNNLRP